MERIDTPLGIPLYILSDKVNDKVEDIPESMAYIVASNGTFIKKTNRLYTSVAPLKGVQCLGEVKPKAEVSFTKMSHDMFQAIETFFAKVYAEHKSEVAVILYYKFDTQEWGWLVPKQTVSSAAVDYDIDESAIFIDENGNVFSDIQEGYYQAGTIHSHASMGAFHSGTDDKDEYNFDGLHITIGSFNAQSCAYACRWMIDGQVIKQTIDAVIEGYEFAGKFPEEAMLLVSKRIYTNNVNSSSTDKSTKATTTTKTTAAAGTIKSPSKVNTGAVKGGTKVAGKGVGKETASPKQTRIGLGNGTAATKKTGIPKDTDASEPVDAAEKGFVLHNV